MLRPSSFILLIVVFLAVANYCPGSMGAAHRQDTSQTTESQDNIALLLVYTNTQYRFHFRLPRSWKGYSTIVESWDGDVLDEDGDSSHEVAQHGPKILIRNPRWTKENRYQDIPIMVFTHTQWRLAESDKLVVSAAPFGPEEIGRNRKYVFALPPRYNYGDAIGIDEVVGIMRQHPLHGF